MAADGAIRQRQYDGSGRQCEPDVDQLTTRPQGHPSFSTDVMTAVGMARSYFATDSLFKEPITNTASRSRGALRPSCAFISLAPLEGVGNAGCPLHPRPRVHFVLVERTRVTTSTPERPAFPHAMVLTAYVVLSPVTGLFCHRHPQSKVLSKPGWADATPRELDASVGASGPHDFAVRSNISRQRAGES